MNLNENAYVFFSVILLIFMSFALYEFILITCLTKTILRSFIFVLLYFIHRITYIMAVGLSAMSIILEKKEGLLDRSWIAGTNVCFNHYYFLFSNF